MKKTLKASGVQRLFMYLLRIVLALLLVSGFGGPAQAAWADAGSPLYWTAYRLGIEPQNAASGEKGAEKGLLLALTFVPPEGHYLYGPEASEEGLPTTLEVAYAPLSAFPMGKVGPGEIDSLVDSGGVSLPARAPVPTPKKDTPFASFILPGSKGGNPLIYPGPITFWVELPPAPSPLGGLAVRAVLSGLSCSAGSCLPVSDRTEFVLSVREIDAMAPAAQQSWWEDWSRGQDVLIPPPEGAAAVPGNFADSAFSGGRSIPASEPQPQINAPHYAELFANLEPIFSNPNYEVSYLGQALFFGLIAGLLLNLMPCVLPVVSLKFSVLLAVSSMTDKQAQARAFRAHCLLFALGIMVWFFILGLLLGGAGWAWGELFQKPVALVVLGVVLFLLALSLFGVFSLPVLNLKAASNTNPHWQAFIGGLLATILATPCSGPLLGGVLAWAIRQQWAALVLTVACIGLGMSLPYILMAVNPRLVHLLPRPGKWTLRLEQFLGFFLMGSVLYMASLLPGEWLPAFLGVLFAVAIAAWLWGQIGHLGAGFMQRFLARGAAIFLIALAVWWGVSSIRPDLAWETFDAETFTQTLGRQPMLVEFTADWCPSCKALEHTTLSQERMAFLRRRYGARTIRVDLTRANPAGEALLKALNSTSIPVLALFPHGEDARNPLVLRDIVTPSQLEEAAARVFSR